MRDSPIFTLSTLLPLRVRDWNCDLILTDVSNRIIGISDMIIVFVGEEMETFTVHKDLLKLHSGLFRE